MCPFATTLTNLRNKTINISIIAGVKSENQKINTFIIENRHKIIRHT